MTDGIKSRSAVSPTFLLGLIGSIFGIVSGVLVIVLGVGLGATIAEIASLFGTSAGNVSIIYALGIEIMFFSVLGLVGSAVLLNRMRSGIIMIISAIGVSIVLLGTLFSSYVFEFFIGNVVAGVCFFIGGVLLLVEG